MILSELIEQVADNYGYLFKIHLLKRLPSFIFQLSTECHSSVQPPSFTTSILANVESLYRRPPPGVLVYLERNQIYGYAQGCQRRQGPSVSSGGF